MKREYFNVYEVAELLECTCGKVRNLAKTLGWKTQKDNRGYSIYFSCQDVLREGKRRIGEKARLQSAGIIGLKKYKKRTLEQKKQYLMWIKAKKRAIRSGIPFNIDPDDIIIPDICPLLGVPLVPSGNRVNIPSLDRIHNDLGYVKGNIWVISEMANRMKQNASIEQLKTFANNVLIHFPEE